MIKRLMALMVFIVAFFVMVVVLTVWMPLSTVIIGIIWFLTGKVYFELITAPMVWAMQLPDKYLDQ